MSNIKGTVKEIGETQVFESGFQKREVIVMTDDPKYPQPIKLEVVKDKCLELDSVQEGQEIVVHYNLRGSEYKGKYYVNLLAWKWELTNATLPPVSVESDDESDSIPF